MCTSLCWFAPREVCSSLWAKPRAGYPWKDSAKCLGRAAPVPGVGICSSWCCCWCNFVFWELALLSPKTCAWVWGRGWVVCSDKFSISVFSRGLWGIAARLGLCLLEELECLNFAVSLFLNLRMIHRLLQGLCKAAMCVLFHNSQNLAFGEPLLCCIPEKSSERSSLQLWCFAVQEQQARPSLLLQNTFALTPRMICFP